MEKKYFCVFHIPSAEYIYCHYEKAFIDIWHTPVLSHTPFLLPPGITYDYDTSTKIFRGETPEVLINYIKQDTSMHYKDRSIEEFEIHVFDKTKVPKNHFWKEFNKDGSIIDFKLKE